MGLVTFVKKIWTASGVVKHDDLNRIEQGIADCASALDSVNGRVKTYTAASTSADGLMSASMVKKLNGIAEGANKYSLPTASSGLGGVKTTSTVTSSAGYTPTPIIGGIPYYKNTDTDRKWKYYNYVSGAAEIKYSSINSGNFDEIFVQVRNASNGRTFGFYLPKLVLPSSGSKSWYDGYYIDSTNYAGCCIYTDTSLLKLNTFYYKGSPCTSDSTLAVWYK